MSVRDRSGPQALSARAPRPDLALKRLRSRTTRGELEFDAEVAPGITVTWDPATPRQCVSVSVEREAGADGGPPPAKPADSSAVAARTPWLRLAAVSMLSNRLNLPLDRSLLDAEFFRAQIGAARTLRYGEPTRELLLEGALVRARRAAQGVVHYLNRLTAANRRPPPLLDASLGALIESYAALSAEVDYDAALVAVTEAVGRLATVTSAPARVRRRPPAPEPARSGEAQIDPRLIPARVLRLGPTVDSAEIEIQTVRLPGRTLLRVQVPAFAPLPEPADLPDVGIRLIHRKSGQVYGYAVLGLPDRANHYFGGLVALTDAVIADDVRVEPYDAASSPPPVSTDDAALRRVRRATLFLAGWRALFADALMWGTKAAPAAQLRVVMATLAPDVGHGIHEPLWAGGPTLSHLRRIAELGDRRLATLLQSGAMVSSTTIPGDDGGAASVVNSVSGPGDLLVAELAAAYERGIAA